MTDDNSRTTQADATIRAIEKLDKTSENQQRIDALENQVQELRERSKELETYVRQLAAARDGSPLSIENLEESELNDEVEEESQEDEEETQEDEEPFFKDIDPAEISPKMRKNAVVEYLKEVREEEGKFETRNVYDLCEEVFDHKAHSSSDDGYRAVYNAVNEDPRLMKGGEEQVSSADKPVSTYKLSNKVKATH